MDTTTPVAAEYSTVTQTIDDDKDRWPRMDGHQWWALGRPWEEVNWAQEMYPEPIHHRLLELEHQAAVDLDGMD